MIIVVQTFICEKDEEKPEFMEAEHFINSDKESQMFGLIRHMLWAARNNRSVTTFRKGD